MTHEEQFVKLGIHLRERLPELNLVERAVLLSLGLRINEERQCWPSIATLAAELGRDERSIQRAITSLIAKSFVMVGRRAGGRGRTNLYTLNGYFAYGSDPLQLIAPFALPPVAKGDTSAGVSASPPRKGDKRKGDKTRLKGDTGVPKRVTFPATGRRTNKEEPLEEEGAPPSRVAGTAVPSSFEAWKSRLAPGKNPVAVLVDAFRVLHPGAPSEDLAGLGGRLAGMVRDHPGDQGYILKLIWNTASQDIQGSHLNYIQKALKGELSDGRRRTGGPWEEAKEYTEP